MVVGGRVIVFRCIIMGMWMGEGGGTGDLGTQHIELNANCSGM